jgi:hypothetical protein
MYGKGRRTLQAYLYGIPVRYIKAMICIHMYTQYSMYVQQNKEQTTILFVCTGYEVEYIYQQRMMEAIQIVLL